MNETDISSIAHLDFDIKQEEPCEGHRTSIEGITVFNNLGECENAAQVRAIWGCCGQIKTLCIKCYNDMVSGNAVYHTFNSQPKHKKVLPMFSQVHFI